MAGSKCVTINVKGLQNAKKRNDIFETFKRLDFDIIALQETHCDLKSVDQWTNEWDHGSFWSTGSKEKRGVAFLFGKNLDIQVLQKAVGFGERFIRLDVRINGIMYQLVNIYGRNPTTEARSENLFQKFSEHFHPDLPCLLFGDFNMVESFIKDRQGGRPRRYHTYGKDALTSQILHPHDLVDVWRENHPTDDAFTYHNYHDAIHSRIDRIYIPNNMLDVVTHAYIANFPWSDHDMCVMNMMFYTKTVRGPGYFKLNLTYLSQPAFCQKISKFLERWKESKPEYQDPRIWWDLSKIYVRQICIEHAAEINRFQRCKKSALLQDLKQEMERGTAADLETILQIEDQLKDLEYEANKKIFHHTHVTVQEVDEKPTRFFYALLKASQISMTLDKIETSDGTVLTDQTDIREEVKRFFETLYRRETKLSTDYQKFFLSKIKKKLSPAHRADLEKKLDLKECHRALFETGRGKLAGMDGLPYEYYKTFWHIIGKDFVDVANFTLFQADSLSESQKQIIITLLFKNKGERVHLKNWRPVSLLCCDYKIMTKTLNNRLKAVLGAIISPAQQSGISDRTIFNNLYLVRDIIDYCTQKNIPGYILSFDQEKAFDKVDRGFLYAVLHEMGFGPLFIRAIKILYTDNVASVLVNGFVSDQFNIERGNKQGCSPSSNLYAIYIEPLSLAIQEEKKLTPLPLPGPPILIMQIADDMEVFLSDKANVEYLFNLFAAFKAATGSSINEEKTEGLYLGDPKNILYNAEHTQPHLKKVLWKNIEGMRILGIIFFTDFKHTLNRNWVMMNNSIQDYLHRSRARDLSLKGRVLVLNTLALSQVWYLATVLTPPKKEKKKMNQSIITFLWQLGGRENHCKNPITRLNLYQPLHLGGLKLKGLRMQVMALQLKFIRDIVNPNCTHPWVHLARYWIGERLAPLHEDWSFLAQATYHRQDNTKQVKSEFYRQLLDIVQELDIPKTVWVTRDLYQQLLTKNPTAPRCWSDFWKNVVPDDKRLFTHIHWSYARGCHQDVMWKYIHRITPTNNFKFIRFTGGDNFKARSRYCSHCLDIVEDYHHVFHNCPMAKRVWDLIYPTIKILMRNTPFRITRLIINNYTENVPLAVRRVINTILQIVMHQIWLNRNMREFESTYTPLNKTKALISLTFNRAMRQTFRRLPLAVFREKCCHTPAVCKVVGDDTVVTNLFHPDT